MTLDARGDIAIVELLVYVPLHFITLFLAVRHGFKRVAYIYLLLLSVGKPPSTQGFKVVYSRICTSSDSRGRDAYRV